MSILHDILTAKRRRIDLLARERPAATWADDPLYHEPRRPFARALRRESSPEPGTAPGAAGPAAPGVAAVAAVRFLCEIKRASPSAGPICLEADAVEVASAYRRAGAAAISLVTEEEWFRGRPDDLPRVRAAGLPVLMKDFLVDPWQCAQARALGADAVLLIAAAAGFAPLAELRAAARMHGLDVLVEIHDESELEPALQLDGELYGINHRDLATFEVDMERGARLVRRLPAGRVKVAESGIRTRTDVERLEANGFDALLVGETLMRSPDPAGALRLLRGAGSAAPPADGRPA